MVARTAPRGPTQADARVARPDSVGASGVLPAAWAIKREGPMARTLLMGLAAAAIPFVSAAAAPATPEEAARLTALFERYVSHPAAGQPSGVARPEKVATRPQRGS